MGAESQLGSLKVVVKPLEESIFTEEWYEKETRELPTPELTLSG